MAHHIPTTSQHKNSSQAKTYMFMPPACRGDLAAAFWLPYRPFQLYMPFQLKQ
jgi:hypothetical protein